MLEQNKNNGRVISKTANKPEELGKERGKEKPHIKPLWETEQNFGNSVNNGNKRKHSLEFSFEIFPPKTEKGKEALYQEIARLCPIAPRFFSVTYGAGGSTSKATHEIALHIQKITGIEVASHLTCVASTKQEVKTIAKNYLQSGIKHILALRGDPQGGIGKKYVPHPEGYAYASDLIAGLKEVGDFEISVAAFPEKHPESPSFEQDIRYLQLKQDLGAKRAITQFFFDPDIFLRFVEKARKSGITMDIVPGILIINNLEQMLKFAKACEASVPYWVKNLLSDITQDQQATQMMATMIATEQCRMLKAAGVNKFHFYTLNKATPVVSICNILNQI